jgi:hypothetical protein
MTKSNGAISPFMTRLLCCSALFCIGIGALPVAADDIPDRCAVPIAWPAQLNDDAFDPAAFWNDDRAVSILRREDGERFSYRIVGDVVELNEKLFPAFATAPDGALNDVSLITIDAREIIVDMPLRLRDGVIELRADTVRFAGGGSIALIDPPQERDQAVDIITSQLDLSRARAVPFVFTTQGWRLTEPPAWPQPDGPKRVLRIRAGDIVLPEGEPEASTAQLLSDPLRWLHNHTADQGFDSGMPKDVWAAGYQIDVGDGGAQAYQELATNSLLWADMVAAKFLRLRSRGAFDPQVDAFLRAKAAEYLPYLDRRSSRHAAALLRHVLSQIDEGVDPFGNRGFDVPMADLPQRVAAFGKSLDEIFGTEKKAGLLQMWDESRVASITTNRPANTAKQIEQVDRLLRNASGERSAAGQRLARNAERLLKIVQDVQAKLTEIDTLDAELRAEYDSRKTAAESYGGAVGTLPSIPIPATFGLLAAAPAALGNSPILATGAGFYYGAKDGSWPMNVPADLKDVAARYASYASVLTDLAASWKTAEGQYGAVIADLTGRQRSPEALAAHEAAMRDLQAVGRRLAGMVKFGPAELKLRVDSFDLLGPEKNEKRFALMAEAEGIAAGGTALPSAIAADLRRLSDLDADLGELGALRADIGNLRNLPPAEAVQRQTMINATMRGALLADVARQAVLLRKGFYFVTGEWPDLADDVLHFADDAVTGARFDRRRAFLFDPDAMEQALGESRAQAAAYYRAFAERRAKQLAEFAEKKPANPVVELFRAAYVDDSGRDLEAAYLRRQFLNAVNRAMAAQVQLGRTGAGFAARPILIPIRITPPSTSAGVELLLGAAVTKVRFRDGTDLTGTVNLRIEHPRWGNVQIDGDCRRVVDTALGDAAAADTATGYVQTISLPKGVAKSWAEAVSPDKPFADVLSTAFPIDAPYYAYVQLPQPGAWSKPPVIDEIEISFIKVGTQL